MEKGHNLINENEPKGKINSSVVVKKVMHESETLGNDDYKVWLRIQSRFSLHKFAL